MAAKQYRKTRTVNDTARASRWTAARLVVPSDSTHAGQAGRDVGHPPQRLGGVDTLGEARVGVPAQVVWRPWRSAPRALADARTAPGGHHERGELRAHLRRRHGKVPPEVVGDHGRGNLRDDARDLAHGELDTLGAVRLRERAGQ